MAVFVERWKKVWQLRAFRIQCTWSAVALVVVLVLLRLYLDMVEEGSGVVLLDPLLPYVPVLDLKWVIYAINYSGLLLGVISLVGQPLALLLTVRAAVVLAVLRGVCLFALPLDPPPGMIPLVDPMIQLPFEHPTLTRDLFFSWHVALMSLLAITVQGKDLRLIFCVFAGLLSILLLMQHAQYTISVIAAPCFAYAAYGMMKSSTVGAGGPGLTGFR